MLALFEHIEPVYPATWKSQEISVARFETVWHFHPEYELTYIRAGRGTRLVGDSVGEYAPGDVVLIGPDLPHTYVSTPGATLHEATVIHFRDDFLGVGFFDQPAFESVRSLLTRASRGVSLPDSQIDLDRLQAGDPAERTVVLLALLVQLSADESKPLSGERGSFVLSRSTSRSVGAMVELMHEESHRPLPLAEIAAAAHLAPTSASRLFRKCTGTTIVGYLNVVRVNAACRLLRDSELSIAAIAAECGYGNLSNFNRQFRVIKGLSPRGYRGWVRQTGVSNRAIAPLSNR